MSMTLLKDNDWSIIDKEVCRVAEFSPLSVSKERKILSVAGAYYGSITIQSRKISGEITGFITHKIDFLNLWSLYKERTVKEDEEVLVIWSKNLYKRHLTLLSAFLPRLIIWVCKKGAYELINNPQHMPELQGEARFLAERPILEIKPEVMK